MKGLLRFLNFFGTVAVLLVLFILVNFFAGRHYARRDFSAKQYAAISDQTRQVLKAVKEPVTFTAFFQPGHELYEMTTDLLDAYGRTQPLIEIVSVDPDRDVARSQELTQRFGLEEPNVIIVHSGDRHKVLTSTDLVEIDHAAALAGEGPALTAWKAEDALTSALLEISQAAGARAWVITGHGELSLDDSEQRGLSNLKTLLDKQNVAARSANLMQEQQLETDLIIIAGPQRPFLAEEAQRLREFLDNGGKALILLDPLIATGLEGLLRDWGVELAQDVVVDPSHRLPFIAATNLLVTTYTQHPIVNKMKTLMTLFPLARSVRPVAEPPPGLNVSPLAMTTEGGWGERSVEGDTYEFDAGIDVPPPVSIAAAVEQTRAEKPARLVVIGDADFASNSQTQQAGNRDLVSASIHWLLSQEQLIGISAKPFETVRLSLTDQDVRRLFWLCLFGLPAVFALMGLAVWRFRR